MRYKGFKIQRDSMGNWIGERKKAPYSIVISPSLDRIYDLIDGKIKLG